MSRPTSEKDRIIKAINGRVNKARNIMNNAYSIGSKSPTIDVYGKTYPRPKGMIKGIINRFDIDKIASYNVDYTKLKKLSIRDLNKIRKNIDKLTRTPYFNLLNVGGKKGIKEYLRGAESTMAVRVDAYLRDSGIGTPLIEYTHEELNYIEKFVDEKHGKTVVKKDGSIIVFDKYKDNARDLVDFDETYNNPNNELDKLAIYNKMRKEQQKIAAMASNLTPEQRKSFDESRAFNQINSQLSGLTAEDIKSMIVDMTKTTPQDLTTDDIIDI